MDEVFMLLADKNNLRAGPVKTKSVPTLEAISMSKDGFVKGRAGDGTPIKAKIGGKSLARRLMEEAEAAKVAQAEQQPKKRRRGST